MPKRKLEGGGKQRNRVRSTDLVECRGTLHRTGRQRERGIRCAGSRAGKNAAIEHAGGDDRDAFALAQGKQLSQRRLIEQRVSAGCEKAVERSDLRQANQNFCVVHPGADGADHALRAQLRQRGEGIRQRGFDIVVAIVDVQNVDAVEAEPFEALLMRPAHTLGAKIEDGVQAAIWRVIRGELQCMGRGPATEEIADLRRDHVGVAGEPAKNAADDFLAAAMAVERSGVEQAQSVPPGRLNDALGLLLRNRMRKSPERGRAQPEAGHAQSGPADLGQGRWI